MAVAIPILTLDKLIDAIRSLGAPVPDLIVSVYAVPGMPIDSMMRGRGTSAEAAHDHSHPHGDCRLQLPDPWRAPMSQGLGDEASEGEWTRPLIIYPCQKKPRRQWCDHNGPGDFMGHTCASPDPLWYPRPWIARGDLL